MNSATRALEKERRPAGVAIPELDAAQKKVIAGLELTREYWHMGSLGYPPLQVHDSVLTRYEAGKALRHQVPRESHAEWNLPAHRPSEADFVIAGNAGRQPELARLRVGRMAASPFAFLRGAVAVMAWDLFHMPTSGIQALMGGVAHINHFGLYGTAQRTASWTLTRKTVEKARAAIKRGRVKSLEEL